jgi:aminoglycoside phosphotransferase
MIEIIIASHLQEQYPEMPSVKVYKKETVQSLWSGYGEIARYAYEPLRNINTRSNAPSSFIGKVVNVDQHGQQPRGWQSDISHQRKLSSYQNESVFYKEYAAKTNIKCAVPKLIASGQNQKAVWLVMEDLDARGLSERYLNTNLTDSKFVVVELVIDWLANFHACFMQIPTPTLWPVGTYWHLATRSEEYQSMTSSALKSSATRIDEALNNAHYQTLLHGDAKLANFCFHSNSCEVAAVDFQYTGRGVGVKDLVYFLGSCFNELELADYADRLTDRYFTALSTQLKQERAISPSQIEKEWRSLIPFAWADFERFLAGWAPSHKKRNGYSGKQTRIAIDSVSK